ncbi:MAG: efflux RND transporter periplasmic adaptor subunit [Betaproteobacteria bacterium]
MTGTPRMAPISTAGAGKSRSWIYIVIAVLVVLAGVAWWWTSSKSDAAATAAAAKAGNAPISVTIAAVVQKDLPVNVIANGSVVALQAVDVRAQISSIVNAIHITEGQYVNKGDLLFTLDARTEEANLKKAEAQVVKSRSDFASAERNMARQQELFNQKFISQAALDTALTQVDLLKGQVAVDQAAADAQRVARTFAEIRAPLSGRTGAIAVRAGTLVQPTGTALVTISQIDPIGVAFSLPERELPYVQRAIAKGELPVMAELPSAQKQAIKGKLNFIESTVDSASGTIAMKATFSNAEKSLWPGSFVNVSLTPRVIANALVIPVQAVQSGPDRKFVYVVGADNKATMKPVDVQLTQAGVAAITGIEPGTRVVVEGAQNVRNGSVVAESAGKPAKGAVNSGQGDQPGKPGGESAPGRKAPGAAMESSASTGTTPTPAPASR